jgi:hypothetical protein
VFADLARGEFFRFLGGTEIMMKYARTGYASIAGAFHVRPRVPVEPVSQEQLTSDIAAAIRQRVPYFRRRS